MREISKNLKFNGILAHICLFRKKVNKFLEKRFLCGSKHDFSFLFVVVILFLHLVELWSSYGENLCNKNNLAGPSKNDVTDNIEVLYLGLGRLNFSDTRSLSKPPSKRTLKHPVTRCSTSIFFLNRDIICERLILEGVKIHYGDVQKMAFSDLMWTIGTSLWKFLLRKIAWRDLWRSPKWNQKDVLKF